MKDNGLKNADVYKDINQVKIITSCRSVSRDEYGKDDGQNRGKILSSTL